MIHNLKSSSWPLYIVQPIACSSNLDDSFSQDEWAYAVDAKIVGCVAKSILQQPSSAPLDLKQILDREEKNVKKNKLIKIVINDILICFCLLVPALILAIFICLRMLNIFHMITIFFLLGLAVFFLIFHHIRNPIDPIDPNLLTKIYFTKIVEHMENNILSYIPKSHIVFATESIPSVMYKLSYTGYEDDSEKANYSVSLKCFDGRYPAGRNIAKSFPIYHGYIEFPVKPQTTETSDIFKYADSLSNILEKFKNFHFSIPLTKENRELSIQQLESFIQAHHETGDIEWFLVANQFIRLHLDRSEYTKERLEKYKQERQRLLDDGLNWLTRLFLYVPNTSFSMPFFHSLEGFLSSSEWIAIENEEKDLLYIGLLRFSYEQQYNIYLSLIREPYISLEKYDLRDMILSTCQDIGAIIDEMIGYSAEPIVHSLLKTAMHTYETSYNLKIEESLWYRRHQIRSFFGRME